MVILCFWLQYPGRLSFTADLTYSSSQNQDLKLLTLHFTMQTTNSNFFPVFIYRLCILSYWFLSYRKAYLYKL